MIAQHLNAVATAMARLEGEASADISLHSAAPQTSLSINGVPTGYEADTNARGKSSYCTEVIVQLSSSTEIICLMACLLADSAGKSL